MSDMWKHIWRRSDLGWLIPDRARVAEIGVDRGLFATCFLDRWGGRIHDYFAVDPYTPYPEMPWSREADLQQAVQRLLRYSQVRFVRLPGCEFAAAYAHEPVIRLGGGHLLDLLYLDAAHDGASVRADLAACYQVVKPGGWLCGHDYDEGVHPEVCAAARDFAVTHGLELFATRETTEPPSFAMQKPY